MKKRLVNILFLTGITSMAILVIPSCHSNGHRADAFGNFEADEVIVSAQSQGILTSLKVQEGLTLAKDQLVGRIDSAVPAIKLDQLKAQLAVIGSRLQNTDAQLKVQAEQRSNLLREVNRVQKLMSSEAATQQQYEDMAGKLKVLDLQTETIIGQKKIIDAERSVLMAQMQEVINLLGKCRITNPLQGTVLEKYVEAGELVSPGKALYKIANTEEMELKVYVSGSQLPSITLGDSVHVFIDTVEESLQTLSGKVSWISSQAEFTPKIIQTREERVNMVYAVKVRVKNDGRLKIGMPGEVIFHEGNPSSVIGKQ